MNITKRALFSLFIFLEFHALAIASFGDTTCLELLRKIEAAHSDRAVDMVRRSGQNVSVQFRNEILPTDYGPLYVLHQPMGLWNSEARTNPFQPQGNPQWALYIFGRTAAAVLGFRILNNEGTTMTVPSVEYLNNILNLLQNTSDFEGVGIRFYQELPEDRPNAYRIYIRNFGNSRALPITKIETEPTSAVHDLSYHLPAITLPNDLLDRSGKYAQILLRFSEDLSREFSGTPNEETARLAARAMRFTESLLLDTGSGILTQTIVESLRDSERPATGLDGIFRRLTGSTDEEIHQFHFSKSGYEQVIFSLLGNVDFSQGQFLLPITLNRDRRYRNFTFEKALSKMIDHLGRGVGENALGILPAEKTNLRHFRASREFLDFTSRFFEHQISDSRLQFRENPLPSLSDLCMKITRKRLAIIGGLEKMAPLVFGSGS